MSSAPDPDLTRRAVEETVGALYLELHRKTPPAAVLGPRSRLDADLGFDSVARAELLTRVERALQIEIPQETLASIDTLADLLRVASSAPKGAAADEAKASLVPRLKRTSQRESADDVLANCITLTDVLARRAEGDPHATHAILLGDAEPRVLTYTELLSGAQAIASGIRALGLGDGAMAALMLPTSADYLHAFFGVLLAGATPVPLYPPARRSQLEEHVHRHVEILTNAGTQLLITLREARLFARLLRSRVPGLRHVMSVAELAQRGRPDGAANASRAESIALLQYTSGSTGSPKGVILTHEHLLANIRAMGKAIAASKDDVMVSWLPLYHDMGLIGAWLGALCFGCPLVLMSPTSFLARPASWLRAIHRYRGTLSGSPNFGYELATRRIADEDLQGVDLSSLRATFNGAEPVSPDTVERFARRFARYGYRPQAMAPVYGQAEAGVGVTFPPAGRGPLVDRIDRDLLASRGQARSVPADRPRAISFVSCGGPLPGYRLRVLDERGSEVPERIEGDLQFAGPSATSGYYGNAEATARLIRGEWRNTGDRAYIADGELYITGRKKDILIRRGRHIYPEEIESAVGAIEGVRKGCVAAFGTRGEETGTERVVVVAETRETDSARLAALRQHIAERVTAAIGEPADEIILVGSHTVLKTSSGKLRRSATRDAYTSGALGHTSRKPAVQLLLLALGSAALTANRALRNAGRLAFGVYACSILIALGTLAVALATLYRSADRIWRLNHRTARRLLAALRVPMEVIWEQTLDPRTPHVIVANHSSYLDAIFLSALLSERHRFVAKVELARVPLIGHYLRRLQTLFIERFAPGRNAGETDRFREALASGDSLVVFPEGTFTSAMGLRAFHLGAFRAAAAAGAPVIPLALRGVRPMPGAGRWLPRRLPVRAVIGAALVPRPEEECMAAAVRMRDAARVYILRHCGEPDLTASEAS